MRPFLVLLLLFCMGCGGGGSSGTYGGSAGLRNGGVTGQVKGNGPQGVLPVLGATVLALRLDSPQVQRSTQTDANGDYVLTDLPLGRYKVGFSASGFLTIPAQSSAGLDAYVESGSFGQLPPVLLQATTAGIGAGTGGGPANLVVTLVDAATGAPIPGATVTAGVASSTGDPNGVYSLLVPVQPSTSSPVPVSISAQAEGYDSQSVFPASVGFVPGQLVTQTVRLGPLGSQLNGRIRVQGGSLSLLSSVAIHVNGIDNAYTGVNINTATGTFALTVPASTAGNTRVFSLSFVSPYFNLVVVSGVVAPQGGALTVPQDVILTPAGVGLTGTVVTSGSQVPGAGSTVTIVELGQQTSIVNGSYSFGNIPMGVALTLAVSAFNPFGGLETAQVSVTPTANGGTFVVPLIQTR